MEEGADAEWLRPIVSALRGLFQRGETRPQVAIVVAVGDLDPNATTTVCSPDPAAPAEVAEPVVGDLQRPSRETSSDGGSSPDGSVPWDAVPMATITVPAEPGPDDAHHATGWSSRHGPGVDDDICRRCGVVHRPGDVPHYWCTQWGKRYHVDYDCYGLRTANRKFPLPCLAFKPHLTPCKLCV